MLRIFRPVNHGFRTNASISYRNRCVHIPSMNSLSSIPFDCEKVKVCCPDFLAYNDLFSVGCPRKLTFSGLARKGTGTKKVVRMISKTNLVIQNSDSVAHAKLGPVDIFTLNDPKTGNLLTFPMMSTLRSLIHVRASLNSLETYLFDISKAKRRT